MLSLKRKRIDTNLEKNVLIGMLVSADFLRDIYPIIDYKYFQNEGSRKIASWCVKHYEHYEAAPIEHISDIFDVESAKMKEEDAEMVRVLLEEVLEKYENTTVNVAYLVDEATKYFKQREQEITAREFKALVDLGDLEAAEARLEKYRKIQKIASHWVNPLSEEAVDKFFTDETDTLFKFPGQLGEFMGEFERGWLIGLSGRFKGGKTWLAQEFGVIGVLNRLRVVMVNLEMPEKKLKGRLYKRITAMEGDNEQSYIYPTFDCLRNQQGHCHLAKRVNSIALYEAGESPPDFSPDNPYRPCVACRFDGSENYIPAVWYELILRPPFDVHTVQKALKVYRRNYGHLMRLKCYPRYSANLSDIKRDLDILEQTEGFIPDIVIVDYVDILKPEDEQKAGVEKEDRSWIALAQLAAERRCLVVTPTQITKEGQSSDSIRVEHMARWVGKLGHVDAMYGVNQSTAEKARGLLRINTLAHRYKDFDETEMVTLIQQISLGQVHLDSQIGKLTNTIPGLGEDEEGE
jgi:hypothetical protein